MRSPRKTDSMGLEPSASATDQTLGSAEITAVCAIQSLDYKEFIVGGAFLTGRSARLDTHRPVATRDGDWLLR